MGADLLYCFFCGKSHHKVHTLIAGPNVFICDECVERCNDILRKRNVAKHGPRDMIAADVGLLVRMEYL